VTRDGTASGDVRPRSAVCRARCRRWAASALLATLLSSVPATAAVVKVEAFCATVSDLAETERFYRDGLGFQVVSRQTSDDPRLARLLGVEDAKLRVLVMRLGAERVEFIQFSKTRKTYPKDSRSPDLWFQHFAIVVSDMGKAYRHLQRIGISPISIGGPQTLPPQNGRVAAFKFRDPDGHPLELLYFPPGQGRAVWHEQPAGRLFLGIDHSAIAVADTARGKAFYSDLLGMVPTYDITNRGPTQEALDGTLNAVVQITGLRPSASDGPGIEFLDYRTPPTGRPAPPDTQTNDLVHVHLVMRVDDLDREVQVLDRQGRSLVSPGIVTLAGGERAVMVRDPDGHMLMLEQ
jgi:catechol 2,3-dioxygenase-like lactoylglutathione lyase family enzyme